MKRIFALISGALLCANALANDVITLKDGNVIEGQIYRTLENGDLCVHKLDGNDILVFATDILSRTQNEKVFSTGFKETKESGPIGLGVKLSYVHGFNSGWDAIATFGYGDWEGYQSGTAIFKSALKNGNGINFGVSYTLGFGRYFFFEPGASLTYLHYNYSYSGSMYINTYIKPWYESEPRYEYDEFSEWGDSGVDLLGFEVPLQIGCRIGLGKSCEWEFKFGPSFGMCWYVPKDGNDDDYLLDEESRCKIGVQFDTGIKIKKKHYIGVGFQLCCWQQERRNSWSYNFNSLNAKRNSLNVTYGYYF